MTAAELTAELRYSALFLENDYDIVHNGLIVTRVIVNHTDRTVELITE